MMHSFFVYLTGFVTAFMAYAATKAPDVASAESYEWRPIERSSTSTGISVTGRVVPQDGALNMESARVQGRILGTLRREGELVTEGTPLYSISSAECFSLQEERRVATSKGLEDLLAGVDRRQKQLGLKLKDDQCFAVSSHSGVLTKRFLESGASFNSGDTLATVLDVHRLTVELDVPERDQARVQPGQKVSFQFASNPGETYSAKVLNVVPTIDPTTRTSKARLAAIAKFPKNVSLDALIFGDIQSGREDQVFTVPASALVFAHNQQFVISGNDQQPKAVPVQVLSETDSASSIRPVQTGALKNGDLVATRDAIFLYKKLNHENLP